MNKNAGMDSRRATNVNDNYADKYNNKHVQAIADRQGPIDGVDVEGGIVTPFNIYKPENAVFSTLSNAHFLLPTISFLKHVLSDYYVPTLDF